MDERYDMMRSLSDGRWLYIRNYRPDLPYVQPLDYMFLARGYQSWARVAAEGRLTPAAAQFWGPKPAEELYDLDSDPDNVKNLVSNSTHHETLERMRAALRRRVLEIRDNGFLPEGAALEGYEMSHKPDAYPVDRVFAMANLASDGDAANMPKLIAALDDKSEPVRWWAAQGCTILGIKATAAKSTLQRRLEDPSAAVQVAAARALVKLGDMEAALPMLERCVQHLNAPFFALQAANVFDRIGANGRPALPVLKQTLNTLNAGEGDPKARDYLQRILGHAIAVLEGTTAPLVYPAVSTSEL